MDSNVDFTPADQVIDYSKLFRLHDAVESATQKYISLAEPALYNPDDTVAQKSLDDAGEELKSLRVELKNERADLGLE